MAERKAYVDPFPELGRRALFADAPPLPAYEIAEPVVKARVTAARIAMGRAKGERERKKANAKRVPKIVKPRSEISAAANKGTRGRPKSPLTKAERQKRYRDSKRQEESE